MISYVKGELVEKTAEYVVVESGMIGLMINVPLSVVEKLPPVGEDVKIYTHFSVREDDMSLFGFLNKSDLDMFRKLLSVNGIGPKGAMGVLGAMSASDLRIAIITGDAKAISKAPGIGSKTAQRIILDLKDKVKDEDILEGIFQDSEKSGEENVGGTAAKEAVDALIALGYSASEAGKAVKSVKVTADMDSEAVLKASLKYLAFL